MERDLRQLKVIEDIELAALAQTAEALRFPQDQLIYFALRAVANLAIFFGWRRGFTALALILLKKYEIHSRLVETVDQL